jgi:hypothetical protein
MIIIAEAVNQAKNAPFTIKEGVEYRMKVKFRYTFENAYFFIQKKTYLKYFRVQHEVVSGLKYLQVVKRRGIRVDKTEEMIGSYGPSAESYEKKFLPEEAPSGMLARGHYDAKVKKKNIYIYIYILDSLYTPFFFINISCIE